MTILVASLLLLLLAVVLLVRALHAHRRLDALSARVAELEAKLATEGGTVSVEQIPEAPFGSEPQAFSADVLAGRSSHVARLLSETAMPADLAEQAVVCVYRRLDEVVRPSDLADELHVSLRTLQRGLDRALGCTPNELILTVKLREARRLLASGQLRVGEVAHRLAFADAAHLSRRYRQFYRCPPSRHVPPAGGMSVAN